MEVAMKNKLNMKKLGAVALCSLLFVPSAKAFVWASFDIAEVTNTISSGISQVEAQVATVQETFATANILQSLGDNLGGLTKIKDLAKEAEKLKEKADKIAKRAEKLKELKKKYEDTQKQLNAWKDQYESTKQTITLARDQVKGYVDEAKNTVEGVKNQIDDFQNQAQNLKDQVENQVSDLKNQGQAYVDEVKNQVSDVKQKVENYKYEAESLVGGAKDVVSNFDAGTKTSAGEGDYFQNGFGHAQSDLVSNSEPAANISGPKLPETKTPGEAFQDLIENPDALDDLWGSVEPSLEQEAIVQENALKIKEAQDEAEAWKNSIEAQRPREQLVKDKIVGDDSVADALIKKDNAIKLKDSSVGVAPKAFGKVSFNSYHMMSAAKESFYTGTDDDGNYYFPDELANWCSLNHTDKFDQEAAMKCIEQICADMNISDAAEAKIYQDKYQKLLGESLAHNFALSVSVKHEAASSEATDNVADILGKAGDSLRTQTAGNGEISATELGQTKNILLIESGSLERQVLQDIFSYCRNYHMREQSNE